MTRVSIDMKLQTILLALLFPSIVFAQALPIRNDTPSNLRDLGSNLNVGRNFAVDQKGQIKIGNVTAGVGATDLGKAEDAVHTTGDTGVACWGIINTNATSLAAEGDYTGLAIDQRGRLILAGTANGGLVLAEDTALTSTDPGIQIFGVNQDPLTVDQASNDYGPPKLDRTGRTITSPYAPHGEYWSACGTATASTGDTQIKANVASNRIYVTTITCKNTSSTTGSNLDFKDGSTTIAVGSIGEFTIAAATNSSNYFAISFPVPLRGTSNTAFNFATNTSVSSVTCCGAGFISVD